MDFSYSKKNFKNISKHFYLNFFEEKQLLILSTINKTIEEKKFLQDNSIFYELFRFQDVSFFKLKNYHKNGIKLFIGYNNGEFQIINKLIN